MINITTASDITPELMRECIDYNPDTGEIRWKVRPLHHFANLNAHSTWNAKYPGKLWVTSKYNGYVRAKISMKWVRGHRAAWLVTHGEWPEHQLDHIDGDRSNNRLANLRQASMSTNCKNQGLQKRNKTGRIGVHFRPDGRVRPWLATIGSEGKIIHLGTFSTKDKAVKAREEAEVKYGYHPNHGKRSSEALP